MEFAIPMHNTRISKAFIATLLGIYAIYYQNLVLPKKGYIIVQLTHNQSRDMKAQNTVKNSS